MSQGAKLKQDARGQLVLHPFNLAGEVAKRAAPEELCTDALVCEDAMKYNRQFCRIPTDYEKYYIVIQPASCEAVEECMGVPVEATATTAETLSGLSIVIETKWGGHLHYCPKQKICQRIGVWP